MDGPRLPGYHPSVTAIMVVRESYPYEHTARLLVGQVLRYGPRRWWVRGPLFLLFPAQDVDLVYETKPVPLHAGWTVEDFEVASAAVGQLAEQEAVRLNAIDPHAVGGVRPAASASAVGSRRHPRRRVVRRDDRSRIPSRRRSPRP